MVWKREVLGTGYWVRKMIASSGAAWAQYREVSLADDARVRRCMTSYSTGRSIDYWIGSRWPSLPLALQRLDGSPYCVQHRAWDVEPPFCAQFLRPLPIGRRRLPGAACLRSWPVSFILIFIFIFIFTSIITAITFISFITSIIIIIFFFVVFVFFFSIRFSR